MNVAEVAALWRFYADEEDNSYVDPNTLQYILGLGYNEFRKVVNTHDSMGYATNAYMTLTSQFEYDLGGSVSATRLLGPTPTQAKMQRLVSLAKLNSDGTIQQLYSAAANIQELRRVGYGAGDGYMQGVGPYFLLRNTVLEFGIPTTGPFKIVYLPVSTVDWSKQASTDTEFIDNYDEFHDLIALMAMRHYMVGDTGKNPAWEALLTTRIQEFVEYLAYGRNPLAGDHVCRDY